MQYPNLEVLKLAGNKFEKLEDLESLKSLAKLNNLDLCSNPIENIDGYREKVYALLPQRNVLDGEDKEGNEFLSDLSSEGEEEEDKNEDFIEIQNVF